MTRSELTITSPELQMQTQISKLIVKAQKCENFEGITSIVPVTLTHFGPVFHFYTS